MVLSDSIKLQQKDENVLMRLLNAAFAEPRANFGSDVLQRSVAVQFLYNFAQKLSGDQFKLLELVT
jgi:hypothetical protein